MGVVIDNKLVVCLFVCLYHAKCGDRDVTLSLSFKGCTLLGQYVTITFKRGTISIKLLVITVVRIIVIGYCLMSREQYFSYTQDQNKFNI